MQLLRTECSMDVGNMLAVRFLGQGGESIEVKLARSFDEEPVTEDVLVAKAAAMMVQVAAFLAPVKAAETSNSISEETAENGAYRFVYREDGDVSHIPDAKFPNVEAARSEAIRSASDLLEQAYRAGKVPEGWAVRVYDDDNNLVVEIDYAQAEKQGPTSCPR